MALPSPPDSIMEFVESLPPGAPLPGFMTVFPFVEMDLNLVIDAYESGCLELATEEALIAANYGEIIKAQGATASMTESSNSYGGTMNSSTQALGGGSFSTETNVNQTTPSGVSASAEAGIVTPSGGTPGVGGTMGAAVSMGAGAGGVAASFELDPPGLDSIPPIVTEDGTVIPNPFAECFPCDDRLTACFGMLPLPTFLNLFDDLIQAILDFIKKMKDMFNKENFMIDVCLVIDALRFICPQDLMLMVAGLRFKIMDAIKRLMKIKITWIMIVGLIVLPLFILTSVTFDIIGSIALGPLKCFIKYLSDFKNLASGFIDTVEEIGNAGPKYKESMQAAKDIFDAQALGDGLSALGFPHSPEAAAARASGRKPYPWETIKGKKGNWTENQKAEWHIKQENENYALPWSSGSGASGMDQTQEQRIAGNLEPIPEGLETVVLAPDQYDNPTYQTTNMVDETFRSGEDIVQTWGTGPEATVISSSTDYPNGTFARNGAMTTAGDTALELGFEGAQVEEAMADAALDEADRQEQEDKKPNIPWPPPRGGLKKLEKFIGKLTAFEAIGLQLQHITEIIEYYQEIWSNAAKACLAGWTKLITEKLDAVIDLMSVVRLIALVIAIIEALAEGDLGCDPATPLTPEDVEGVLKRMPGFKPSIEGGPPMEAEIINGVLVVRDPVLNKTFDIPTCVGTMPEQKKDELSQWIKDLETISI